MAASVPPIVGDLLSAAEAVSQLAAERGVSVEKPRYLTTAEIEDIVSVVPPVIAAAKNIADHAREQIIACLRLQLGHYRVAPSGIESVKGWIVNQFRRSVIQPGEPVGVTTAESIGQPITQSALSSFHYTAALAAGVSPDGFRELFDASRHRKYENTTLHFRNKNMSFDEVLMLRSSIVGVTVADLTLAKPAPHFEITTDHEGKQIPLEQRGAWYAWYHQVMGKRVVESRYYLRLHMNTTLMYAHGVLLDDIVRVLEAQEVLHCVASPSYLGIIDIYPDEQVIHKTLSDNMKRAVTGITETNASLIFLQHYVLPYLSKYLIKGIAGISKIFPVQVTTWSVVMSEEPYFNKERQQQYLEGLRAAGTSDEEVAVVGEQLRRTWSLNLDRVRMRISGITVEKVARTLELCGIIVASAPPEISDRAGSESKIVNRIDIVMPDGWERALDEKDAEGKVKAVTLKKPGDYVNGLIRRDEMKIDAWIMEERKRGGVFPTREPTELMRWGTYVYAEANGINLRAVLAHPLLDPRYCICNNPHEILEVLGAEACRNYMTRDFYNMIAANSSYVNPRYIMLIADIMTSMGMLIPITSRGVARQNRGAFADASFERPVEAFLRYAYGGSWQNAFSTSACIFMGIRAYFGTGIMMLALREEVLAEIERREQAAERVKRAAQATTIEAVKKDTTDLLGTVTFDNGDVLNFETGLGGIDYNAMFATPEAITGVSAPFQAPLQAAPGTLPIPGVAVEEVPKYRPNLLVPKGPLPTVRRAPMTAPTWLTRLVQTAPPKLQNAGLPALPVLNLEQLLAAARAPTGEVEVEQLDIAAFLE